MTDSRLYADVIAMRLRIDRGPLPVPGAFVSWRPGIEAETFIQDLVSWS